MEPSQDDWSHFVPDLPIPISYICGRYLLFDVKAVSYLRREHRLCGYNIGTLPQSPSQNVFLGLPTIIMPEEAQLLIDKRLAYLLDVAKAHDEAVYNRNQARKAEFMAKIRRQANEVEKTRAQEQEAAKRKALGRRSNASSKDKSDDATQAESLLTFGEDNVDATGITPQRESSSGPAVQGTPIKLLSTPPPSLTYHVTPTTSRPLLDTISHSSIVPTKPIPNLPRSYPLFRHLHDRGYFMTPGLRFGCQYAAYPGDPLRFHSHFLAIGLDWEEEIDLMEIVGGGRLGTGVKKGFLIGGEEQRDDQQGQNETGSQDERNVRTFGVEWAAM